MKYIEYCGEWHDEDCAFVATDQGVCNCNLKKNRKKVEKQKDEPPLCVQCGREMTECYGNEVIAFPFCTNNSCPNFSLLTTGILPPEDADQHAYE